MNFIYWFNHFISNTLGLMKTFTFTPLLLIGLLITSLSLILTLKNNNIYIKEFKNHKNSEIFVDSIYKLSGYLLFTCLYSVIIPYFYSSSIYFTEVTLYSGFLALFSIIYLFLLFKISIELFMITFRIKSIVISSLKD
ncbi:putative membrane protein [Aliarcobacter cryaerophilus D2610]|nr:putative membrane protein [Aliarcobacter cryaerophilus D2610]